MLQVGTILHQAKSGRLIVTLTKETRPGALIVDDKGRKIGRVMELLGPVKAPFASVGVSSSRFGKAGDPVFLER